MHNMRTLRRAPNPPPNSTSLNLQLHHLRFYPVISAILSWESGEVLTESFMYPDALTLAVRGLHNAGHAAGESGWPRR